MRDDRGVASEDQLVGTFLETALSAGDVALAIEEEQRLQVQAGECVFLVTTSRTVSAGERPMLAQPKMN